MSETKYVFDIKKEEGHFPEPETRHIHKKNIRDIYPTPSVSVFNKYPSELGKSLNQKKKR